MTRVPFDQSAKALLEVALAGLGQANVQFEVSGEPRWVDVWFVPAPSDPGAETVRERGLLGRMARTPALFEAFHDPPAIADVFACMGKQIALGRGGGTLPPLWIVAGGRPEAVLRDMTMAPRTGWPPGVYWMPTQPLLPVFVVVTAELPEERDTLLVRLMGSGPTLRRAVREARMLADDAWERRPAMAAIHVLRSRLDALDLQDRELTMEITETYAQWEARVAREGRAEGKAEGKAEAVLRLLTRRFGPLGSEVEARVRAAGHDELDAILDRVFTATTVDAALG